MTEQEWLATKVMGWTSKRLHPHQSNPLWWVDEDKQEKIMQRNAWNPRNNIEQAFMLLDKLTKRRTTVADLLGIVGHKYANLPITDAIVDAVLQATGYEDE